MSKRVKIKIKIDKNLFQRPDRKIRAKQRAAASSSPASEWESAATTTAPSPALVGSTKRKKSFVGELISGEFKHSQPSESKRKYLRHFEKRSGLLRVLQRLISCELRNFLGDPVSECGQQCQRFYKEICCNNIIDSESGGIEVSSLKLILFT